MLAANNEAKTAEIIFIASVQELRDNVNL